MATTTGKSMYSASGVGGTTNRSQPGLWNYAVPLNEQQEQNHEDADTYQSSSTIVPQAQRQPLRTNVNGNKRTKSKRNQRPSKTPETFTTQQINGHEELGEDEVEISGTPEEVQSRLAAYRPSKEQLKGGIGRNGVPGALNRPYGPGEVDSKWIHRDKLAQIESRELAEMGLRMGGRPSRSGSAKTKRSTKAPSIDSAREGELDALDEQHDDKRRRMGSPHQFADEALMEEEPSSTYEVNNMPGGFPDTQTPTTPRKQSVSGIPVRKPGQGNDSGSGTETDSPGRSRQGSLGGAAASSFGYSKTRARSNSAGSQNLLDSAIREDGSGQTNGAYTDGYHQNLAASPQQSPPPSPPKQRNASAPLRGANKTMRGGKSPQRPRTASGPADQGSRPGTSNGKKEPLNRPEGDPPWIATMYKPDPRLPPDQQMLPTHAKRLAEEQRIREEQERQDRIEQERIEREEQQQREREALERNVAHMQQSQFQLLEESSSSAQRSPQQAQEQFFEAKETLHPGQSQLPRTSSKQSLHSQQSQSKTQNDGSSPHLTEPRAEWPLRTPSPAQSGVSQSHSASPQSSTIQRKDRKSPGQSPDPNASTAERPFGKGTKNPASPVVSQPGPFANSNHTGRAGTPNNDRSGYGLMPQVETQEQMEQRMSSRTGFRSPSHAHSQSANLEGALPVIRVPEANEKDDASEKGSKKAKKEGGCGACCVVM